MGSGIRQRTDYARDSAVCAARLNKNIADRQEKQNGPVGKSRRAVFPLLAADHAAQLIFAGDSCAPACG